MFCQTGRQVSASARPIMSAPKPNISTVSRRNPVKLPSRMFCTFKMRSAIVGTVVAVVSNGALLVPALEISCTNFGVGQQLAARSLHGDLAVDHHVAPMREPQGVKR